MQLKRRESAIFRKLNFFLRSELSILKFWVIRVMYQTTNQPLETTDCAQYDFRLNTLTMYRQFNFECSWRHLCILFTCYWQRTFMYMYKIKISYCWAINRWLICVVGIGYIVYHYCLRSDSVCVHVVVAGCIVYH